MTNRPHYRVALVGAGGISEFHVRGLQRLPNVEIVGVTDLDADRAQKLCHRFGLPAPVASLEALLSMKPDAVHVLTPPSSHAAITLTALEAGCHVLVEKPLATSVEDCDRIAATASRVAKSVGVNHTLLCDPFVKRALDLVRSGSIGEIVSADYFRSQSYPGWASGPVPPQYRDGGFPFRDMGVHALYLMQGFLGEIEDVQAMFEGGPADPNLMFSEWRTLVRCKRGSGQFHLSWNIRPQQNLLIVQGTRGFLKLDLFGMTLTVKPTRPMPEFVQRAYNAMSEGMSSAIQVPSNVARVATKRILRNHGLQALIADFYESLAAGRPPLVTPASARNIVEWTERVARQADAAKIARLAQFPATLTAPILVTGASGFIGRRLVDRLLSEGQRLRVMVRRAPAQWINDPRIEVVIGDLGDADTVDRAVAGTSLVYHVGAAMNGNAADFNRGTVVGTQNLVDSAVSHKVGKLVYISSLSVLSAAASHNQTVKEDWPLEPKPEQRGAYTRTKLDAERIVSYAVHKNKLPAVILRPGIVFGPGRPLLTPSIAQRIGKRLLVLGDGELRLPLVYIDDVIDGIRAAADRDISDGSIFHLVDGEVVTQNDVLAQMRQVPGESDKVTHLPLFMVEGLALGVSSLATLARRAAPLSIYRVRSTLAQATFDCTTAKERLGWRPQVGVKAGMSRTLEWLSHGKPGAPASA